MKILLIALIFVALFAVLAAGFFYIQNKKRIKELEEKSRSLRRQVYELAILKELGERVGHSLRIESVVDIITGSLNQFIDYSAIAYMLFDQGKVLFKITLSEPASKDFINDVRKRMVKSLEALTGEEIKENRIEEVATGSIAVGETGNSVKSFFNIPLVISGNVAGVLTIADTKEELYNEEEMTLLYKVVKQASEEVEKLKDVVSKEKENISAMVASMSEGVIMTDSSYNVMVVNPAAKKALGIENENPSIFDITDSFGASFDIKGKLEESVKLGRVSSENKINIKNRSYQTVVSPVRIGKMGSNADNENIFGGVVLLHDITREMEVEKMRKDFTAMMVHELRTPLDGIKKMSEIMISDKGIADDRKIYENYVSMIGESTSGMLDLVNQLLDIARIESNRFELFKKDEDIKVFIKEQERAFDSDARDAKIHIEYKISEDIPNTLSFDKKRIAQVFRTIMSQAISSSKDGGDVLVQAFAHKHGRNAKDETTQAGLGWHLSGEENILEKIPDSVIIEITNSGDGYSKKEIEDLFNKFKQFESSARGIDNSGTGINLVIAKGIVEAHGGIIGVLSENEKGSTFYFTLKI